ncbi:MAG: hypothetical protein GY694_14105 [Gammaproteobacteria bacterium]|nr:hypothetical protein [Gammaproteobacteria bacterium]
MLKKPSKNAQKRSKNWRFWVVLAMGNWVSMFFLVFGPSRSIGIDFGVKKKNFIFSKNYHFF